jgi:hypothetical protein
MKFVVGDLDMHQYVSLLAYRWLVSGWMDVGMM